MHALIPAAGYGTRFLPASKTIPKEMLPVGAKPAIQLIVEEALAAGADDVVVVTSPDKPALKRHFDPDPVWHARCARKPALDAALTRLEEIGRRIVWVEQTEQKGLGHAVLQASRASTPHASSASTTSLKSPHPKRPPPALRLPVVICSTRKSSIFSPRRRPAWAARSSSRTPSAVCSP